MEKAVKVARRRAGGRGRLSEQRAVSAAELERRTKALEERLTCLSCQHDELHQALSEAAQTQRRLCGPHHLRCHSFEIAGELFPLRQLSGDFLCVCCLEGDLLVGIGDIAGKGLAAGLWLTHIVGMARLLFNRSGDPGATLVAINNELAAYQMESAFTSMFLARLDPRSGVLVYSNAGHPPPLLIDAVGQTRPLGEGGPLLGVVAGAPFPSAKVEILHGETLVGFSDGIMERTDGHGHEFGTERIIAAALRARQTGARATLFSILAALGDFGGNRAAEDDLGILVVQRAKEAQAEEPGILHTIEMPAIEPDARAFDGQARAA
jgi:sigma-B regulation protein RsbU (phosphoserine phosphatase)